MKIEDLLIPDHDLRGQLKEPEIDPLTMDDMLQEAQVVDLRFVTVSGLVGIIFELRQALQLDEGNTGVLVCRGVQELAWSGPSRDTPFTAWTIGSSQPQVKDRLFSLNLFMWPSPGAQLSLTAQSAVFYEVNVLGLPEVPPDYHDDREVVVGEIATWDSLIRPVSATFLDLARGDDHDRYHPLT